MWKDDREPGSARTIFLRHCHHAVSPGRRKRRQSEAMTNLTGLFTAQKSFPQYGRLLLGLHGDSRSPTIRVASRHVVVGLVGNYSRMRRMQCNQRVHQSGELQRNIATSVDRLFQDLGFESGLRLRS